ncbi:hypothetical protein NQ314_003887, partial [Rhamnusium bicolor]
KLHNDMNLLIFVLFIYAIFTKTHSQRHCQFKPRFLRYYKIRNCYKSTLPVIAWANTPTLRSCIKFARHRNALAFNFSPMEAINYRNDFTSNCQALGCPEIGNSSTFVMDVAFDYYSAYGNWNKTENATCIKSLGIFSLITEKQNYNKSIESCQNIGADLADVSSEVRTNYLSNYINNTIQNWYKAAYVGLDDIQEEGIFRTVSGTLLTCFRYRAWGPGHPRSKHKSEDCVILDSDKMWRVVKCRTKLQALCEFYPEKPAELIDYENITCNYILDKSKYKNLSTNQ